ncbi:hypothetical protein WA026_006648 [Henosepilachna vigintioctopunctata]|uniref:Uncharacterized protein n=1 Tax=Henosepilachna vigintioctopunctata TaxID=420089 RepID=A0AAW1UEK5_9CUCU
MALELGSHNVMPLDFSSGSRENVSPLNIPSSQPPSPPGSSAFTIVTPKELDRSIRNIDITDSVGLTTIVKNNIWICDGNQHLV